ncbi:hypothetical protein FRB90_012132 [Tulasnella sp. 427]|nr:hypothetical protein FRB90_012132 [Tulasnella sp. 427]
MSTSTNAIKGTPSLGPKAPVTQVPPTPEIKLLSALIKEEDNSEETQVSSKQPVNVHIKGPLSQVPQQVIVPNDNDLPLPKEQ